MLLLFFALGAASTLLFLYVLGIYQKRRFLINQNPNFAAPGRIVLGNFNRFIDGFHEVFPNSPAQSYIMLHAYKTNLHKIEETRFFIRSSGKRNGKHSFKGELRLSPKDRHHVMDALPMLERIGAPLTREDKSYGMLVLKTSKLDDASDLLDVAREFSQRVLGCSETDPLTIGWHIARYHSTKAQKNS